MLTARTIFEGSFDNDEAFRLPRATTASGRAQRGPENGRIPALILSFWSSHIGEARASLPLTGRSWP